jgi:transmembrane sensor
MNPNESHIEEHLLLKYLLGNCDADEQTRVRAWLNESKANQELLDKLEALWLEAGKMDPPPVAVDIDVAWERMSLRMDHFTKEKSRLPAGKLIQAGWMRYALGAAALVLLLIGIYGLFRMILGPVKEMELVSTERVVADTLPDGSLISLNKNSRLIYPERFSGKTREVRLAGEAFFDVKRDSMQPFIIDAGIARVRVLGTSFRVKAYKDSAVEVNVTKGRVLFFTINKLTGDTSSVILTAGAKGVLPLNSIMPLLVESSNPDDLFWFDRTLEFRRTPLSVVFSLLEKHYPVTIRVDNERINKCLLTATFSDDPVDRILQVIAGSFDLKVSVANQTCFISGNGCNEENK